MGIQCRESAGIGPVLLKAVSVTGAAFSGITMDQILCAFLLKKNLNAFKPSEHPPDQGELIIPTIGINRKCTLMYVHTYGSEHTDDTEIIGGVVGKCGIAHVATTNRSWKCWSTVWSALSAGHEAWIKLLKEPFNNRIPV